METITQTPFPPNIFPLYCWQTQNRCRKRRGPTVCCNDSPLFTLKTLGDGETLTYSIRLFLSAGLHVFVWHGVYMDLFPPRLQIVVC